MARDLWRFNDAAHLASEGVDLSGFDVLAQDGRVGHVAETTNDVAMRYVVVDTGGRCVALPAGAVDHVDPPARALHVDRTVDEVRGAPEFDPAEKGSASFQDALAGYYHGLYDTGL